MRTTKAAAVIAVLAVAGLVASVTAVWPRLDPSPPFQGREPGPPVAAVGPPAFSGRASGVTGPGAADRSDVSRSDARLGAVDESAVARPVRVTMDVVDIDATVRPVGVAADGQMQLPPDPRVLGWYRFGPAPGAGTGGSTVLAGHLDSNRFGLGPLVRLRDVEIGDTIEVAASDGRAATYTVVGVTRYERQGLPDELFSRRGPERLRIITCGGEYDASQGGYQQNLVVTAVPA